MTKIAYETITPFWLLTTRFAIAFLIFLLLFGKRVIPQIKKVKWTIWLPSCLCGASAYISCNLALNLTSATNVGFLMSLPVLFAPLLATAVLHKHYEWKRLPLQLIAVVGLFLLCCNSGSFSFGLGEALALFEALSIAGILVFTERALTEMDVFSLTALQIGITALCSLAGALLFDDISVLSSVSGSAWLVVIYLAVFCSIIAYLLQNSAVSHLTASTVSMLQCTHPILTAIVSYFMIREVLSGVGLLGAVIIVVCLLGDSLVTSKCFDIHTF